MQERESPAIDQLALIVFDSMLPATRLLMWSPRHIRRAVLRLSAARHQEVLPGEPAGPPIEELLELIPPLGSAVVVAESIVSLITAGNSAHVTSIEAIAADPGQVA